MQFLGLRFAKSPFRRFVIVIIIALGFARVSSLSNETDKSALLAFKAGIIDDPLGVLSSWNNTVSLCRWYGVTCSRQHHNRVTVLDLNSQKLTGSISPHIGNLSFLRKLWLINNSFHHEIPSQIGRLHRLRYLSLSKNSLTGEIPKNTSGCLNLLALGMHHNQLNGEVPPEIGSLVKLQALHLGANHLTGSVPSSIGNLSSLEDLTLQENYLGGSLPQSLGLLTKLTSLGLGENRLSGTVPPSLYNLSSLLGFDVGYNQIHGSLPTTIGFGLPNLEFFGIEENQFVGSIPLSMPNNATNLRTLQLGSNKLSGKVPSFESLRNLQGLSIEFNHLGSGGFGDLSFLCSLTNITSLNGLSILDNRLGGLLPAYIGNLSINMTWLGLGMNPIFGEIPKTIGNLVNLEVLWMGNNFLSGAIPSELGNLQNLTVLILCNNNLSGVIPSSLQKTKKLLKLYLDGNQLYGHIPSHLEKCQNLMELDLANNNLNGSIFPAIKTLLSLNLSHNRLSGALSAEVGKIEHLITLDISGNMFGGEIPSTLGDCDGLEVLKMKDNHFQGSIPQSFSSLRSIEDLDLSNNNLSGEIPKFLETFHFLEILNLSYNNFEGMLPTEGVFKNASATFIAGNNKICGGIPEFQLPKCISSHSKSKGVALKLKLSLSVIFGILGVVLVLVLVYVCWLKKKKAREPTSSFTAETKQNLSYGTLLKATDGFSSTNLIGVGSFGSVYKGILQENGTKVAVKVLNLTHHGVIKSFKAECEALKRMKHRNLLKVLAVCSSTDYGGNDFKALVYELMVNGSLEEWLHPSLISTNADGPSKKLSLIHRIKISIDVAFALDYLHNQCHSTIVHCDIKPSNVLLDDEMVGHVGDFGLSKIILESTCYTNIDISSVGLRGTIGYAAPEYGMGSVVSTEGDVYSYGILLLEMLTGISPAAEIFKENSNLHNFVVEALPERVLEITDPFLVQEVENDACQTRKSTIQDCLLMIYRIGIACSVRVPRERMSITDVAAQLGSIRDRLYEAG
ncbi:probable LRR receptor-like serine/threonine-protein kinase At3g47570 [Rhodamnia argentea]|uniref:Probable LRR receptor-like serine/threonine-protein kinase At3g47570 n=1 Tax=Rhodamnia argentea TaxID=178133 RepID=A0A8B8PIW5_9MYRT|nr:probable LRR receptor-like serine/threonine-protein kinase At3g47570 [Rhodamnia argentea]